MNLRKPLLVVLTAALLGAVPSARAADPAAQVSAIADQLNAPATHAAGVTALAALHRDALGPLYDVLDAPDTTPVVSAAIRAALPDLHRRAREEWNAAELQANKAWARSTSLDVYNALPHPPNAWDAATRAAMETIATVPTPPDLADKLDAAIALKSNDPLIRYLWRAKALGPGGNTGSPGYLPFVDAVTVLKASKYPDARKFFAQLRLCETLANDVRADTRVGGEMPPLRNLLPAFAASHPSHTAIAEVVTRYMALRFAMRTDPPSNAQIDGDTTFLEKIFPDDPGVPAAIASACLNAEVEFREYDENHPDEPTSPPTSERLLAAAEGYALESCRRDGGLAAGPTLMLEICIRRDDPLDVTKRWYERAMRCDPDNYRACNIMLGRIKPQMTGDEAAYFAFARSLGLEASTHTAIPTLLWDAYEDQALWAGDVSGYLARPEVWADVAPMWERMVAVPPENAWLKKYRGEYLASAAECAQWAAFLKLADRFGKDVDWAAFGGEQKFRYYKKKALAATGAAH